MEDYVRDFFSTFRQAECCVMKEKCYRSMSKSEKPHEMTIIFESNIVFRKCSCKAGQGRGHHLSALKESDDASACTSKSQQWHVPRGKKIEREPCMQLIFFKTIGGKGIIKRCITLPFTIKGS